MDPQRRFTIATTEELGITTTRKWARASLSAIESLCDTTPQRGALHAGPHRIVVLHRLSTVPQADLDSSP
jgi:hypothetical protein